MAKRRSSKSSSRSSNKVSVERARGGQGWVLVHPRDVLECAEDLEEVREMIAAGEADVAVDELRWLVETCPEMIEAHYLLGKLAVESMGDVALGRGHFGFGYQLGQRALAKAKNPAPVTALHPANRPFFDAGRGLAWCLAELGKRDMALEVIEFLLKCDPSDPLGLGGWVDEIRTAGAPMVELGGLIMPQAGNDRMTNDE